MAEQFGIFEVNDREGYVRINHSDGNQEYIVSEKIYGSKAVQVTNLFSKAYRLGVSQTQSELKKAIGIK